MSEELDVLKLVARRLESAGIAYMVTGSTAMNYYAVPRMTRDIDVVVALSAPDSDRLCDLFEDDFYLDRDAVRRAIEERRGFNLIHTELVVKVDFVVRKDSEYRQEEFSRRRQVRVEDADLFVVAPEDLIISKLLRDRARRPVRRGEWMRDTSSETERRYREMLIARSGEERVKMACSMFATARALVLASALEQRPLASPAALRQALFLRLYGHEFDANERAKITAWLGRQRDP